MCDVDWCPTRVTCNTSVAPSVPCFQLISSKNYHSSYVTSPIPCDAGFRDSIHWTGKRFFASLENCFIFSKPLSFNGVFKERNIKESKVFAEIGLSWSMLIDFAKVFDIINYGINLLEKLQDYDIQGSAWVGLCWLQQSLLIFSSYPMWGFSGFYPGVPSLY